jgi:hypothetical protein
MKTAIHRLYRFTMASVISVLLYLYVHEQALRDRVGLGLVAAVACFLTIEGGGRILEARRERREAIQRENHRKHQIEADEHLRARVRAEPAQTPKAKHVLRIAPETPPTAPQRRRLRWWAAPAVMALLILGSALAHDATADAHPMTRHAHCARHNARCRKPRGRHTQSATPMPPPKPTAGSPTLPPDGVGEPEIPFLSEGETPDGAIPATGAGAEPIEVDEDPEGGSE